MLTYKLDYAIEKILQQRLSPEQSFLKNLTGETIAKEQAKYLWNRIQDHKWNIGERLQRDVGLRVAAIDFLENFYEPKNPKSKNSVFFGLNSRFKNNHFLNA